jgi:hypothetical protein
LDEGNIEVTMADYLSTLNDVKPAFGVAINTFDMSRLIFIECFETNCFHICFISNNQQRIYCLWHSPLLLVGCRVNTAALYLSKITHLVWALQIEWDAELWEET